jgi:hypothetical protein
MKTFPPASVSYSLAGEFAFANFTRDDDFYDRQLCHAKYGLVHLAVERNEVALFVRRFLQHPLFDTQAKRMGTAIRVSATKLSVWRLDAEQQQAIEWM